MTNRSDHPPDPASAEARLFSIQRERGAAPHCGLMAAAVELRESEAQLATLTEQRDRLQLELDARTAQEASDGH